MGTSCHALYGWADRDDATWETLRDSERTKGLPKKSPIRIVIHEENTGSKRL